LSRTLASHPVLTSLCIKSPMRARTSTAIGLLLLPLSCADRSKTCSTGSAAAGVSHDAVLLQLSKASLDKSSSDRVASMKPPLCDQMIVEDMCRKWNLGESTSNETAADFVTADVLRGHMTAKRSSMESAWSALGFDSTGEAISCHALCEAVIQYIDQDEGATWPPWSDVACLTIEDETTCDVDVSPVGLARKLATADVAGHPVDGSLSAMELDASVNGTSAELPPKLVQYGVSASNPNRLLRSFADVANGLQAKAVDSNDEGELLLSLGVWESVERIANAFRIFPSRTEVSQQVALLQSLEGDSVANKAAAQEVARYDAQAKAWISVILNEMASSKTAQFRRKWFGGGEGRKSKEQVRQRVQYTMNFVRKVLAAGPIYIYPAEQVRDSGCKAGAVAYVWKSGGPKAANGAEVNQGPVCNRREDAYNSACGLDRSGRYFIFLCESWRQASESYKIETLIHEAVHHSGPSDIQYDRNAIQSLSQADQLGNAANYQNFAQDIAQSVYGCGDDPNTACAYYKSVGYCGTLENIKQACRLSCGLCNYGSAPSRPATPSRPAASSSGSCRDTEQNHCAYYARQGYCSTTKSVQTDCQRTCGLCR